MRSPMRLVAASPWARFLVRRTAGLMVSAVLLIVGSFLMSHAIPGDPVRASLGAGVRPELVEQRRAELHLDRSLPVQFGYYVGGLVRLDFGESIPTGEPVGQTIRDRLPNTVALASVAIGFVLLLGIPLGLLLGAWTGGGQRRGLELGFTFSTGIVTAIPEFLMGTLLVAVLAVKLGTFPASGKEGWDSFVLPALALALAPACFLARVVRVETVNVLGREYMMTARSKQLPTWILYARHAVPNALTAALTIAGVVFASLLGGSVIVESIFNWPGIGTTVSGAILNKDYPTVQACVLLLGLMTLFIVALVDVVLVLVNPRLAAIRD
jgi:peptide/nickel transport system permease protein